MVVVWLEGDNEGRPSSLSASALKRDRLGVRRAGPEVKSATDDFAVGRYHEAPHPRIRLRPRPP